VSGNGGGVKRIAISGGIGAGKSTVTSFLRERGYVVVDADEIAHQQAMAGSAVFEALVDAFGPGILHEGTLDRSFLASVVFSRSANLSRLNAITHRPIGIEMQRQLAVAEGEVAFVAIPLLRTSHRSMLDLDEVWTIITEPAVALERLVQQRGMSVEDARARLAAQDSNDQRRSLADVVFSNDGSRDHLLRAVVEALEIRGLS
jgi:dephospho-CoA kinase